MSAMKPEQRLYPNTMVILKGEAHSKRAQVVAEITGEKQKPLPVPEALVVVQEHQDKKTRHVNAQSFYLEVNDRKTKKLVEVSPDSNTAIHGLEHNIVEKKKNVKKLYKTGAVVPIFLYNLSYMSESDTITVGGLLNVNASTGKCSIPRPLIMFSGDVATAINRARKEVGGQVFLYFFAILGLYSGWQVVKSLVKSFKKGKFTR